MGLLRVEVTDTGVGIHPESQKMLFGEFVQFNKNDLQGGGAPNKIMSNFPTIPQIIHVTSPRWLWTWIMDFPPNHANA